MGLRFLVRWVPATAALACVCLFSGQESLVPPAADALDEYERTLIALERYRALAAEDEGGSLPETEDPVEPGERYDGVTRLIRLLQLTGDLTPDYGSGSPGLYDDALVAAVRRFQRRHGLDASGRIDTATQAQLNTPLGVRVHQLELALERWRRRPYDPARPAIVLNLPEFRLRAYSGPNRPDLEMKIIVGQASEHPTPLFSSQLASVIFRPYWHVPVRIQREEMVPKILDDPHYLASNHLEIVTPQGSVLSDRISDGILDDLRSGELHLRQAPGPGNALGLAAFFFPNDFDVYMHGTSAPRLFNQSRRDLSHGCIRLEQAADLAEWVLRDEPGWTRDRIDQAMQGSKSVVVKLSRPIQVVTMYNTAVALENGEVHFFDDIYGEDAAFEKELARAGSYR